VEYYAGGTSVRAMAANGTVTELFELAGYELPRFAAERLAAEIATALTDAYQAGRVRERERAEH
jgi:hypothetical protein